MNAFARALRVLEYVATGGETANISAAARSTQINRATLLRLIDDMTQAGVLEQRANGGLGPGLRFLTLASQVLGSQDHLSLAARVLPELRDAIGMSTYLVTLDGPYALYLQKHLPDQSLVSNVTVGSRVPAHLTTPGRMLLSVLDRGEVRSRLGAEPLERRTTQNPGTYAQLWQLLHDDAARGCAWSLEGFEPGVVSCAAAVRPWSCQHEKRLDGQGGGDTTLPRYAVSTAGPSHLFDEDRAAAIESAVVDTARRLADLYAAG